MLRDPRATGAAPRLRRIVRPGLVVLAGVVLAACSVAPRHVVPDTPVAAPWKGVAPQGWVSTDAYRAWQDGHWWKAFGDPLLDALASRVEVGNQNLAQAAAAVAQAEAVLRQTQAQRWPGIDLQASTQRHGRPAGGTAAASLGAAWAPDLWDRLGSAARAQGARVQASEANLAAARLAAQAGLAQAYFALREADTEAALMDEIIVGYERAVTITQNAYDAGIAARTDLLQAQSTLASGRSTRAGLRATRDTLEHAIALLVGAVPAEFSVPPAPWIDTVFVVPPELPSELLLRRPDVAAAERAVAAANAEIGVARAAWFPSVNLSAGLGASASSLDRLVSAPVLAWSLGASLGQALFDAGGRDAAIDQARAAHAAATAAYRQAVLAAIGQVEDQLAALAALAEQAAHARTAADAAAGAEVRMMNSYRAGMTAYTNVVTAQASALAARRALMQVQLQRQQVAVTLVQALGGGWQAPWADAGSGASGETAAQVQPGNPR